MVRRLVWTSISVTFWNCNTEPKQTPMWQIWRRFNKGWRNSLLIGRHFFVYQATLGSTPPSTWRRNQFCFILFSGPKWNHGPWGHSRGNVSQGKIFFCNIIKIACETSVLGCLQIGLIVFTPKISVLQDLNDCLTPYHNNYRAIKRG